MGEYAVGVFPPPQKPKDQSTLSQVPVTGAKEEVSGSSPQTFGNHARADGTLDRYRNQVTELPVPRHSWSPAKASAGSCPGTKKDGGARGQGQFQSRNYSIQCYRGVSYHFLAASKCRCGSRLEAAMNSRQVPTHLLLIWVLQSRS